MVKHVLKECPIFEGLSDADLDKISSIATPAQYEAGHTLFVESVSAERMYVMEKGRVALQMGLPAGRASRRITVDVVGKNDIFGWSALVESHRYTLTAVCLEPTNVLGIDGTRLRSVLEADQKLGYKVLSRLINLVASRLDETRRVLISERMAYSQ